VASLRLFVAAPLPGTIENRVDEILAKISKQESIRWVPKGQLHITLRFIGAFDESLLPKLEQDLKGTSLSAETFEAEMGGFDAFPRLERAKVLFLPVIRGEEEFKRLERGISFMLEGFGVKPDEKEYHPHLTLGRVRENKSPESAVRMLQEICPAHWEPWRVDRFVLFRSRLAPGGSVYARLKEFEFGKG
jgi:RNA 2',3'-cyclic 3'-phosphodiesterase